jgi:hypothetical protein
MKIYEREYTNNLGLDPAGSHIYRIYKSIYNDFMYSLINKIATHILILSSSKIASKGTIDTTPEILYFVSKKNRNRCYKYHKG